MNYPCSFTYHDFRRDWANKSKLVSWFCLVGSVVLALLIVKIDANNNVARWVELIGFIGLMLAVKHSVDLAVELDQVTNLGRLLWSISATTLILLTLIAVSLSINPNIWFITAPVLVKRASTWAILYEAKRDGRDVSDRCHSVDLAESTLLIFGICLALSPLNGWVFSVVELWTFAFAGIASFISLVEHIKRFVD